MPPPNVRTAIHALDSAADAGGLDASFPAPLTALVGRERETAAVCGLFRRDDVRLVTLTGPGGVGKTRLALRVAEEMTADFPDGIAFIPLAAIVDPSLVLPSVARALGLRDTGDRPVAALLRAHLRPRTLLLLLDNVEQLLPAAPDLARLLSACPKLKILATSRMLLRVSGEHAFPVPPLALPGARGDQSSTDNGLVEIAASDAVRLFVKRGQAVDPDLTLTPSNATDIAEICRRLDGLPLAIELAAARMNIFSPATMVARLERRLPLLVDGPRDQPLRLRTMRQAIAWSYDLLSPPEQALFRRLSVFVGGFTLDAVEAISYQLSAISQDDSTPVLRPPSSVSSPVTRPPLPPSVFDLMSTLLDHSLLRRVAQAHGETPPSSGGGLGGEPLFVLLETIREYGLEQLSASGETPPSGGGGLGGEQGPPSGRGGLGGELGEAREAHAAYFLAMAERAEPELEDVNWSAWADRLVRELPNLRAALGYWREREDGERAVRLAGALGLFWTLPAYVREGRAWLETAIALPGADQAPASLATALNALGMVAQWQSDSAGARAALERAGAIRQALGDELGVAEVLGNLGNAALGDGDLERAEALLAESLPIYERHGKHVWVGETLMLLGHTVRARGAFDRSVTYHEAALEVLAKLPGQNGLCDAWHNLAWAALLRGDLTRSRAAYGEGLALALADHDRTRLGHCICTAAGIAGLEGDGALAARLFAAAAAQREAEQIPLKPTIQAEHDRLVARAREALGAVAFAAAWASGRVMALDDAVIAARRVFEADGTAGCADSSSASLSRMARSRLTSREREILQLLVGGLSDKEIAAALGITRRTASNHVAAILDKLGTPSRTAAATLAIRDRLV